MTYTLTGGVDMAKFSIVGTTGVLTFMAAPDFENPQDLAGATPAGDNDYEVEVTVTDSGLLTDVQAITVTVRDDTTCAPGNTDRYEDRGDGTVLDCNTELFWLRDASCAALESTDSEGRGDWATAEAAAAALASGTCGLTDGSAAGEWRQPTIGEFCSRDSPTPIGGICPVGNASDSLINTNFFAPAVSDTAGTGQWTTDDPFVGVQSNFYWSATENGASGAWNVNLVNGNVNDANRGNNNFVWPVRGGQ